MRQQHRENAAGGGKSFQIGMYLFQHRQGLLPLGCALAIGKEKEGRRAALLLQRFQGQHRLILQYFLPIGAFAAVLQVDDFIKERGFGIIGRHRRQKIIADAVLVAQEIDLLETFAGLFGSFTAVVFLNDIGAHNALVLQNQLFHILSPFIFKTRYIPFCRCRAGQRSKAKGSSADHRRRASGCSF